MEGKLLENIVLRFPRIHTLIKEISHEKSSSDIYDKLCHCYLDYFG